MDQRGEAVPVRTVPMTEADRRTLRRARAAFARASLLLGLAAATAVLAGLAAAAGVLDAGIAAIWTLLCIGWCVLLRRAPLRWRAAGQDLAEGRAQRLRGIAGVRQRRGIGLVAPSHHHLLLAGRRFAIDAAHAERLREGLPVEARVARRAEVLLSVEPPPAVTERAPAEAARASQSVPTAMAAQVAAGARPLEGETLTERERALLALIAAGRSDKEIARRLGLEPATVRTYNSQLYAKLGVRRRTEAVARGRALGLLTDVEG